MKKVFLHLPDYQATGLYRAVLPARHCQAPLAEEGIELTLSGELRSWDRHDAYVFHRTFNPRFVPMLGTIKRRGGHVVMETDDNLWQIPEWNPVKYTDDELGILSLAAETASSMIVSTDYLKHASGHPEKCHVCPNLVDLDMWPAPKPRGNKPLRILWAGSPTHSKDLEVLIEPIGRLLKEYGERIQFLFWGYCHPEIIRLYHMKGIGFIPPVPLADYIPNLMDIAADIALCPLADNEFNKSKSNIKWLEMSLSGAAVVASDVGPYQCIRDAADGMLAHGADDWYRCIKYCIQNIARRALLAKEAASRVAKEFSWQSNAGPWLDAFRAI